MGKEYTFSETYNDYSIDDYIQQGDDGPWFQVVPKEALSRALELLGECENTIRGLNCGTQIVKETDNMYSDTTLIRVDRDDYNKLFALRDKIQAFREEYDQQKG